MNSYFEYNYGVIQPLELSVEVRYFYKVAFPSKESQLSSDRFNFFRDNNDGLF